MKKKKIFLTGATGNVGAELVKKLTNAGVPFKALVRDNRYTGYLRQLPEAEIVRGDLTDRKLLIGALRGVERAFLLTNSSEEAAGLQLNFVAAALEAGVPHIVKLSQLAADEHSPVRFLRYHAQVENRIRETPMNYTFLRPNLFMQGLLAFKDLIKAEGKFYAPIGEAAVSIVDVRDIASVAALALTSDGHANKTYNITGRAALTHDQMAAGLSEALGRTVEFVNVRPRQMEEALKAAGFPQWQTGGLIEDYAHYARGEAAAVFPVVKELTGSGAISFEQFAGDYRSRFL